MTAGHDAYDGDNGMDALLLAIIDEPLPEEARANPAILAEHRSAAADVALLREQLGLIGRALTEDRETEPATSRAQADLPGVGSVPTGKHVVVRPVRPPRRPLALAFRGLAVACAGALVVGLGWLVARSGGSTDDTMSSGARADSGSAESQSAAGYLSCSRLVVEGTVTAVEPVPGTAQQRVTLHVTRSYKPEKGGAEVSFVWEDFLDPRPGKGQHVLVGIPYNSAVPDKWVVDPREIADERAWITRALPEASGLTCE